MKQQYMPQHAPSPFRRFWRLKPNTVFLNHGSFGACPEPILALQTELRHRMEAEPVQFLWRHYEDHLEPSRAVLAQFLGAHARDVVFVTNTTTGVNAVARSLKLRRGDELLTTSHDYNACHNVLTEAAHRAGARVVVAQVPFPLRNEDEVLESVLKSVTPRTRLVMLDHVSSETGLVFPLSRLIRELDAQGVDTLIDGAHAPGMVKLGLSKLRPTYYTGNLHKWVCAPKGAAFLWAREDKQACLQPPVISHGNNRSRPGFSTFQDRFDWAGTFDPTAWMCVGEAIQWLGKLLPGGWSELRARNHALAIEARRLLCRRLKVRPPCPQSMLGSMATIPLPPDFPCLPRKAKLDSEQERLYDEYGIEVPFMQRQESASRWFRISAQAYNSPGDYEYLADALDTVRNTRAAE